MKLAENGAVPLVDRVVLAECFRAQRALEVCLVPLSSERANERSPERAAALGTEQIQAAKVVRLTERLLGAIGQLLREELGRNRDSTVLLPERRAGGSFNGSRLADGLLRSAK
jgi:hypothetical protein